MRVAVTRDEPDDGALHVVITGLLAAALFVFSIITVVRLVLPR